MYTRVCRMETSFPWTDIAGFHPRKIREHQIGQLDCFEGTFFNEKTHQEKPFRFYVRRGANLDCLAYPVWEMIGANQILLDVFLN
jgi:hypothetical protein